jgi:hypothetical protein
MSALVVTAISAVAGIVIAREFGRTEETDGFFAAYGVFIVIVLASQAIRISVLPDLARARDENRLAGEIAGFAIAIALVALPLVLLAEFESQAIAGLLTGDGSEIAQGAAAEALRWMVPAAALHLFVGLAASGLAALDDYVTAAAGYALGSAAGLTLILVRVEPDGIIAIAWGMALNAAVAFLVPGVALGVRGLRQRMPAAAVLPAGQPLRSRLGMFAAAAVLPIALQMLYVVCLPFAGRLGTGAVTSFGYAYLAAASLVSVTAFSLGLVTSVPLTRTGLGSEQAARHVVSASWIALVIIGGAAGVFALAGADVVEAVLGDAYGGGVGEEVGRLVVVFGAWMVASVGVNVTFPLLFIVSRMRALPWIGVLALAVQVPLAWASSELLELDGLAISLALTTLLVLVLLLRELGALRDAARGLVIAAAVVGVMTAVAFLPAGFVLAPAGGAAAGVALYCVLLALTRPRGLTASWAYLRALR